MIKYVQGNLLDSDCEFICHQVNCKGVMGAGIAKQIRKRWPEVYEAYRGTYENHELLGVPMIHMLGNIELVWVDKRSGFVINMYSQNDYINHGGRNTSYDAFAECLEKIRARVPEGSKIGFPKNIGCGLGGGNWTVVSALIEEILSPYYDVYIYEYES